MPSVTFDTLVAECTDGAALIDAAWRGGYDVALVEITQVTLTPQSPDTEGQPALESLDSTTALQLSAQLFRVTGRDGNKLLAETSGEGLVLSFSPAIVQLIGGGLIPGRPSPPVPKALRIYSRIPQMLRIISMGSYDPQSVSTVFTPMQQRHVREAVSLFAHSHARRDIFVSENVQAFIRDGRRQALRRLLKTRILTPDEFAAWLTKHNNDVG